MAGGVFAGNGQVKEYGGKLTASVIITCVVAASGGLIFGYDIGISGSSISTHLFSSVFHVMSFFFFFFPSFSSLLEEVESCRREFLALGLEF